MSGARGGIDHLANRPKCKVLAGFVTPDTSKDTNFGSNPRVDLQNINYFIRFDSHSFRLDDWLDAHS